MSKIILRSENEDLSEWVVVFPQEADILASSKIHWTMKWQPINCRWLLGQEGNHQLDLYTQFCIWLQLPFFFDRFHCPCGWKIHGEFVSKEVIPLFLASTDVLSDDYASSSSRYFRQFWLLSHSDCFLAFLPHSLVDLFYPVIFIHWSSTNV